ncbi:MAG: 16S rRNA (cytosine(1402)-N(4))-methyltransferase RsmH [Chloroflexi bacterium]|nr:MAG: 16S rRNA (cytosine(1402)-N(4))-methyltransferase RsmH [Chloroflexota bacterium]
MAEPAHVPVLYYEVMAALNIAANGTYIDGTLGGGGHAQGILERSSPAGRLLGLDRDPRALEIAQQRLQVFAGRLIVVNRSFAAIGVVARGDGFTQADGILLDLGLSSLQLADPARGFSFLNGGPLDMRFDPTHGLRADEIVNHWSEHELADMIYRYGEEPRSRQIARAIVRNRPLHSTTELAAVIARGTHRRGRIHPATRTFQALRIAVNDELAEIERALPQSVDLLRRGGRLAVISFHSLEDRLVKNFLRAQHEAGLLSILTKKPLTATAEEASANPRSRSAKLRIAVRE